VIRQELAAWSLSAAGGVLIGLALLTGGTVGLVTAAVLVVAAMRLIQRMAALAGIIVGFGATVLAGGMLANAVCAGAGEGQAACHAASGGTFILAFAAVVLLVGVGLTLVGLRARSGEPGSSLPSAS
jgi:hypothetical protein